MTSEEDDIAAARAMFKELAPLAVTALCNLATASKTNATNRLKAVQRLLTIADDRRFGAEARAALVRAAPLVQELTNVSGRKPKPWRLQSNGWDFKVFPH
jgi:hypothetical protein